VKGLKKLLFLEESPPKMKLTLMQTGGRLHGNPFLVVIETNGGRAGKFGVIYLILIDEAQAV
jgi:hypothetical protein